MGFPPHDGGRHRMHEPDIGAPRTNRRDCEAVTVAIPMQRTPDDPPTTAIRHVVMPPPAYDPYGWDDREWDDSEWDDSDWDDAAPYRRSVVPATGRGQWGVALGIAVVATCAAYIAVAGIGGLHGETAGPAASVLSRPEPSATFPVSAVVPAVAPAPAVPKATRAPATTAAEAVTTPPTTPPTTDAASAVPKPALVVDVTEAAIEPTATGERKADRSADDGAPQVASPPQSSGASAP